MCVCVCVAAECLSQKDKIMNKTCIFFQETQGLRFSQNQLTYRVRDLGKSSRVFWSLSVYLGFF